MGKAINDRVILPSTAPSPTPTPSGSPSGTPTPTPSPSPGAGDPAIVADCMTNANYNACVFYKNPLAHANIVNPAITTLSPAPSYTRDYSTLQTYGVNITGLSGQYLENSFIKVNIDGGSRAVASAGSWKFNYPNDSSHKVAQVMAYYFINEQKNHMINRSGKFYADGKNIQVTAFTTSVRDNAYWNPSQNQVVMGEFTQGGRSEAGISADVYCHEMGHANLSYANSNATRCSQSTHTSDCKHCRSKAGCMGALNEGQADFHAALYFPQRTAIGEMFMNNINGFNGCIARSPDNFLANPKTAAQVYSACGGEIHWMGVIYNAIWYAVWKKQNDEGRKEVETLFTEHFVRLSDSDTFPTALDKAKSLDSSLFGGKYTADFNTEINKYQF